MISIGKYLHLSNTTGGSAHDVPSAALVEEFLHALLSALRALLRSIEDHAVVGDRAEFDQFRQDIHKLGARLDGPLSPEDVVPLSGEAARLLEGHQSRVDGFQRAQNAELQAIISMLSETLVAVSSGADRGASKLQQIEKQMEKACVVEDLIALRARLRECLTALREEAVRQRHESTQVVRGMEQELLKAQERIALLRAGLPGRADAEQAVAEAFRSGRRCFAVIYAVERFRSISSRFGAAAMDDILRAFVKQALQKLTGGGQWFRWNLGALVMLLERREDHSDLQREVRCLVSAPLEKTIQIGDRMALVSVTADWLILPVFEASSPESLIERIDSFVDEQL